MDKLKLVHRTTLMAFYGRGMFDKQIDSRTGGTGAVLEALEGLETQEGQEA